MKRIFVFGFILQCIVTVWSLIMDWLSGSMFMLQELLVIQVLFSIVTFILLMKKKWKISYYSSIITSAIFILYLVKHKPDLLYITSVLPLIVYYLFITAFSSFKKNEKKINSKKEKIELEVFFPKKN